MDRHTYIETRRKRYLAQTLEEFEKVVETLLDLDDPALRDAVTKHKVTVRRKFQALATDCLDIMSLDGEINVAALEITDRLSAETPR